MLSSNQNAIHLLEKNVDKVDWYRLANNPNAIYILEQNVDKICWSYLSSNPNATHLLAKLDYVKMRLDNQDFVQDLVAYVCHPNWIQKCATRLNMDFDEYQDLLAECNVIYLLCFFIVLTFLPFRFTVFPCDFGFVIENVVHGFSGLSSK